MSTAASETETEPSALRLLVEGALHVLLGNNGECTMGALLKKLPDDTPFTDVEGVLRAMYDDNLVGPCLCPAPTPKPQIEYVPLAGHVH